MKNKRFLLIIYILLMIFQTGCFDSNEIDEQSYAIMLGVDALENGNIRLTVIFPVYSGNSESDGGQNSSDASSKNGYNIYSANAASIEEGLSRISSVSARGVSLLHTKVFVFSEALARIGLQPSIDSLTSNPETSYNTYIIISAGSAEEYIKKSADTIDGSLSNEAEFTALQLTATSATFVNVFFPFRAAIISPYETTVAAYADITESETPHEITDTDFLIKGLMPNQSAVTGPKQTAVLGLAVFRADKLVGVLDSYEVVSYLMIRNLMSESLFTISSPEAPDKKSVISLKQSAPCKIKADTSTLPISVKVILNLEFRTVSGAKLDTEYIRSKILEGVNNTILKTQTQFKSDILGFGRYAAGSFKTIQEWEAFNYPEQYPDATINVEVNLKNIK